MSEVTTAEYTLSTDSGEIRDVIGEHVCTFSLYLQREKGSGMFPAHFREWPACGQLEKQHQSSKSQI
jgi:hypothetical protein